MIAAKKAKSPYLFEAERDQPLTERAIAEIERNRGIRFPEAFIAHLATEGAGDFAYGSIYSPDSESTWSLWNEYQYFPDMLGQIVPFSDNGGGDYYCFPVVDGQCQDRVFWADHEQDYQVIESDCADFREFVAKICLEPA